MASMSQKFPDRGVAVSIDAARVKDSNKGL